MIRAMTRRFVFIPSPLRKQEQEAKGAPGRNRHCIRQAHRSCVAHVQIGVRRQAFAAVMNRKRTYIKRCFFKPAVVDYEA